MTPPVPDRATLIGPPYSPPRKHDRPNPVRRAAASLAVTALWCAAAPVEHALQAYERRLARKARRAGGSA